MHRERGSYSWIKYVLIPIPFIIGFLGFLPVYDNNVLWTAYSAVQLYGFEFNIDVQDMNLAIEIARWAAPIATLGIVFVVCNAIRYLVWRVNTLFRTGYVIYGSSQYAKALATDIGSQAYLTEQPKSIKCKKHIIMLDSDEETIGFCNAITKRNNNAQIYMQLSGIFRDCISASDVVVFNMEENCARLYWKEYPVINPQEKIAVIGFSELGQAILHFGLLTNVIDPSQNICYHVFGDSKKYAALHTELDKIEDTVVFYEEDWYCRPDVLKDCDRVILCGDDSENLRTLGELTRQIPLPHTHIRVSSYRLVEQFFNSERVYPFGMTDQLCTKEIILQDKLFAEAKQIHDNYASNQIGALQWKQLDMFKRYSNVAAADHIPVKKRLFKENINIETLSEIEHIRWSRYYYMNNWKYAVQRDDARNLHNCLIPYSNLPENEKQKDRDNLYAYKMIDCTTL